MRRLYHEAVWRALWPLCSNRAWGLYHGPEIMRRFSAWLLPWIGWHGYYDADRETA